MSKYMQLNVRIRPHYEDGFAKAYPAIAKRLRSVGEPVLKDEPSLFEIVKKWDLLLDQLGGDPSFKELLLRYGGRLQEFYGKIEENIVDWHLSEADQMLYKMEDMFEEIDREAAGV